MTDEQLKEKIQKQFAARGMNAEVTVEDGKVQVRVRQESEKR
jgi:nitrogen fixation protein FixH